MNNGNKPLVSLENVDKVFKTKAGPFKAILFLSKKRGQVFRYQVKGQGESIMTGQRSIYPEAG